MPRFREFKWASWSDWTQYAVATDKPSAIAVDTETTGLGFYDEPFCATLTWRAPDGELKSGYVSLEGDERDHGVQVVRDILASVPTWVMHNAKFDLQKLGLIGALPARPQWGAIEDTQVIAALTDENQRKGLKFLAANVLKVSDVIEIEVKSGPNKGMKKRVPRAEHELNAIRRKMKLTKDDPWDLLPREFIVPYAIKDTEYTLRLFELMKPALPEDVLPAYAREIAVTLVLLDMEANGLALDIPYLEETTSTYGVKVMEGWMELTDITGISDPKMPNSPKQLTEAFAARGIRLDSTAEPVLSKLTDKLAVSLLQYRSDKKMHGTYLTSLLSEQRDGIVHPWFNPVQARSGRMSSSSASQ